MREKEPLEHGHLPRQIHQGSSYSHFLKENTNLLYFSTLPLFQFFIHPKNWYKKEDRFFTPPGLRGWDKVYPKTTDLHYTMRPGDAAVLHWDNVPMPEEVSIRMTGTQR